jgi:hypothetical protein
MEPRFLYLAWACFLAIGAARASSPDAPSFSRDILPILSDHCFACHGPDEHARKGGLRLDTREGALAPGDGGAPAVVPHRSSSSELLRRIRTTDADDLMPPTKANKPLTTEQKSLLTRWIDSGAAWGLHWAYEPPRRPAVPGDASSATSPETTQPQRGPHPIDAFIEDRLQREGLTPTPEAPATTLVRRVTLDLTGLPPTPTEIDAFLADTLPGAWERLVDRLLASPRYGERMAWEWLEASRYADSNGYQGDADRTMWPWRDWVVDALNRNLPFDTFSIWQLAGDLLPDATFEQRLATGFVRNHMINGEGGRIPEENRIDYLFDQTETVGTIWLGATLNCTRCHNHKFDPITQRDYFGLLAYFNRTAVDGSGGDPQSRPNLEAPSPEQAARRGVAQTHLERAVAATVAFETQKFSRESAKPLGDASAARDLPKEILDLLQSKPQTRDAGRLDKLAAHWKSSDPAYAQILEAQRQALAERDSILRSIPRVMVMEDVAQPRDTFVLGRGLYTEPGAKVTAALPPALSAVPMPPDAPENRLALAQWLFTREHPLTARVTVNRYWQTFFGTGLVKTSEDFGVQGEKPSHPELLDWLAIEFIESGWNTKHLHRLILTSRTYRRSSQVDAAQRDRDPDNRLLARAPRFRMPSWMIRDAALAASGLLNETRGGPPVKPYQPAGVWEEATFGNKRYTRDDGDSLYRRSLYVFWRRIVGPTLFFDVANRQTCTVRTPRTNVPLHALLTLNDDTYVEAARALAQRVLTEAPALSRPRLHYAARLVLGRPLTDSEIRILLNGLDRHRTHFQTDPDAARRWLAHGASARDESLDPAEHAAWTTLCSTLLNLDESLSRE